MVPILTRIRAKSLERIRRPRVATRARNISTCSKARIVVHTEFYDPVTLKTGEAIYIDSNMGHAYVAAEDCEEALVLGVCSSADEGLMNSLMNIHGPEIDETGEPRIRRPAA